MASGTKFKVVSSHPEDTADGRVYGPGEEFTKLDLKEDHNKALIDDGRVIQIGARKDDSGKDDD